MWWGIAVFVVNIVKICGGGIAVFIVNIVKICGGE
jgi:hypothetical protein